MTDFEKTKKSLDVTYDWKSIAHKFSTLNFKCIDLP